MSLGANTGGGGGGGAQYSSTWTTAGGHGGSGVVMISYPASFESASYTGIIPHDHWYHTL